MKEGSAVDWEGLGRQLDGQLCTDAVTRRLLSTDASIFRVTPAAVAYPATAQDVARVVAFARANGISVHPRGAGSGLCGACLGRGIVVDFSRHMNRLVHLDAAGGWFECEPGYRLGELELALKGSALFFPPDPSSGEYASFGGMFNTNASGAHSVKYGTVADYVRDAEVILGTGQRVTLSAAAATPFAALSPALQGLWTLYRDSAGVIETAYPTVRFNSTGYNLRGLVTDGSLRLGRLLAGAEGTLGIATRLAFNLAPKPSHDSLGVAFFADMKAAVAAVGRLLPMAPSGIEIMDKSLLDLAATYQPRLKDQLRPEAANVLLIEFDGFDPHQCRDQAARACEAIADICLAAHPAADAGQKQRFWALRKAAVPILYKLAGPKKILALVEDAAVPTDHLPAYVDGIYAIMKANGVDFVLYGHIAKGLLHTRPLLNLKDPADVAKLQPLADAIFELVDGLGGVVSGEHGDGRLRSAYVKRHYPAIYPLFQQVKNHLDPAGIFNPGIITGADADQMACDLRFGAAYRAADPGRPRLNWPEGFVMEVEKCHGCSKCTTVTTATRMCPVFKFTRNEAAAPKAKANLLFALLSGNDIAEGLFGRAVQQVVDLCVNCGSCAKECPSGVNIPKLALEAKSRYAARYGAPLASHLVARVEWAARLTHRLAPAVQPAAEHPLARRLMEAATGISARRRLAHFAGRSLFDRVRPVEGTGAKTVVYFAGCYAGYVRPEIGLAAVRVLTRLGFTVHTPKQHCCGLPLLSKALPAAAADRVGANRNRWAAIARKADAVVVTCSSCGLALRHEWAMVTDHPDSALVAEKLVHLSTLVAPLLEGRPLIPQPLAVAYHRPCHLNVQPDPDCSVKLLRQIPQLALTDLTSHCCGMAGTWGLSAANADLSLTMGADLMARIRASGAAAAVTDCPTCRMQIEEPGSLPVYHPVELLDAALGGPGIVHQNGNGCPPSCFPKRV